MKTAGQDFTRGPILKQLVTFSGPIILANLLQTSYQLIDSLWVGNLLGAQALGAVTVSTTIIFTVLSFVIGMTNAALAILSQQKGRGDEAGLRRYLNAFVVILFSVAIILGVLGFFSAEPLLKLLGTPEVILLQAKQYLQINFLGILFLFGYNFISTILRALGDSKTPMRFIFVAVILNIFLDPLFIHVFALGVKGAAIATVISQGVAFVYGIIFVIKKRMVPFERPHLPSVAETKIILNVGVPSGLQMAVISAGIAAIMSVVNAFSADIVGGFGAAQRLDALIMLPAQALGITASAMAGQNIGAGNWARVKQISRIAVLYNLAIMLVIALVLITVAPWAVRLFISDTEAVEFGAQYLRIIALCYPFIGINFVLNGVVRASGSMYQVLVLNILSFWALRYPLTAFFASKFGEPGIAMGIGLSFMISSLLSFLYFRFGGWRNKELFAS